MQEFESRTWTGRDGKTVKMPSVRELIDKYVPVASRAEVTAMQVAYEKEITRLLGDIWFMQMQLNDLHNHLHALELEYGKRMAMPVSLGRFEASHFISPLDQTRTYQVEWRPDPLRCRLTLSEQPMDRNEYPLLFQSVLRQFRKRMEAELLPQLEREFVKLYEPARR